MPNIIGEFDWARREERVAAMGKVIDVGVGQDAQRATGLTGAELSGMLQEVFHELIDGGANMLKVHCSKGIVDLYVRRRKKHVDAGTRKDFAELGWQGICDLLDREGKPDV